MKIIILELLLLSQVIIISSIQIKMTRRNIFVPENSNFSSILELQRQNAELIPTLLSLQTLITNTIPQFGDYFDYFYFLTDADVECYNNAVKNQSYLFPCSFLTNHYSKNRISQASSQEITQEIDVINDAKFTFIVDNTLFPYPQGAYSYSSINIDIVTTLTINVSSNYEVLGTRLIFINATIFIIFLIIIIVIICKTKAISRKMIISKSDSSTHENHTPNLEEMDDNESSFISEEGEEDLVREEEESPEVIIHEVPMLTEKLRSSHERKSKVKSGLIQYLGSRADEE